MRRFFTEFFREPAAWFERRLAYTRSVATNSIVGYIIGLGDRHIYNILIDTKSAELVHIDLGVAFEQGKLLKTPETVPFRLTRDTVDGMGVTGVDGVFRRSCEETMRVMRHNQRGLITILEVFQYDPLFSWQLSSTKAAKLQNDDEDDAGAALPPDDLVPMRVSVGLQPGDPQSYVECGENLESFRTLALVRRKLQGNHDDTQLNVIGHVNQLIGEATDERNLSQLYVGWNSWV